MVSAVSGRRIFQNTAWNILGQVLPLAVTIAVLPHLIQSMGLERYGYLALAWVMIGYASLFDFGIGIAMTRLVASHLASDNLRMANQIASLGLLCLAALGSISAALLFLASGWIVNDILEVPMNLANEAIDATKLLSLSLPFVLVSIGYSGILAAHQRFAELNFLKVFLGVITTAGPLAVVMYVNRLEYVVAFVVLVRCVATIFYVLAARRSCSFQPEWIRPTKVSLAPLLTIGGWTGISNIISPLLTYLDRFIVGGLLTLQAVAFYVTAYDMVTRLSMLPLALMGAVFPVSSGLKLGDEQTARLFNACTRVLLFVSFCILFPLFILAEPVFSLWISPDFATHAAPIFKILCIGILFNMVAQAPVVFIFSVGHPKWLSVLHLIELPIFLTLIWWATSTYGVIGTAVAATTRYAIDALLVYEIARRKVIRKHFGFGADLGAVLTIFLLLLLGPLADTMFVQLALVLGGLCFFCWYTWSRLLSSDERNKLLLLLRRS